MEDWWLEIHVLMTRSMHLPQWTIKLDPAAVLFIWRVQTETKTPSRSSPLKAIAINELGRSTMSRSTAVTRNKLSAGAVMTHHLAYSWGKSVRSPQRHNKVISEMSVGLRLAITITITQSAPGGNRCALIKRVAASQCTIADFHLINQLVRFEQ